MNATSIIIPLVIANIVAFGFLLFFMKKMMVGDTESAINRLNESYGEMNKKKEEIITKIQQIEQEYQKRKEDAEKVAIQIKEESEKETVQKRDEAIKKAHDEAERIVSDAVSMKDKIREELRKEERMSLVDFCEEILSAILKDVMRDKISEAIIDDFLVELKDMDMSHVPPHITEIELIVSAPLPEALKSRLTDMLYKKLTTKPTIKESVDAKILGGVIVKLGSLVLDAGLSGKIKETASAKKQAIEQTG